jgi:hypothetical protein
MLASLPCWWNILINSFRRDFSNWTLVNPGSPGEPKTGDPKARYALWHDGKVELRSYDYDYPTTIRRIERLNLSAEIVNDLTTVLRIGKVAQMPSQSGLASKKQ